jgi:hypothetical protein
MCFYLAITPPRAGNLFLHTKNGRHSWRENYGRGRRPHLARELACGRVEQLNFCNNAGLRPLPGLFSELICWVSQRTAEAAPGPRRQLSRSLPRSR